MPRHEYKCECGNFEIRYSTFKAILPTLKCEDCGGTMLKQFSVPSVRFKGNGFYETDKPRDAFQQAERNE